MDIQKIERRLKKISTLLETFKEDNIISNIEKDLLLGYIRELYAEVKDISPDTFSPNHSIMNDVTNSEPIIKEVIKEVIVEKIVEVPVIQKVEAPVIQKVEEPAQKVEVKEEIPTVAEPKVAEIKIEVPVIEEAKPTTSAAHINHTGKVSKALEALFIKEEIADLSDKISMSKITDIMKAIGINKRLELTKELFDGKTDLFNNTINKLNTCASFEEAKSILIHEVALPLEWEKEEKLKEAQQLVKLVMRKFN